MWLCPSLSRPLQMERLVEGWENTTEEPLVLRLHQGDPLLPAYMEIDYPSRWEVRVGPLCKAAGAWRWAFKEYPNEDYYGFIGDDCEPLSLGWAESLALSAMRGKIAFPDDGLRKDDLPTHPCIGGDLVRMVGFWAPEGFEHYFIDNVWKDIGTALGLLERRGDVLIKHWHPLGGETEMDAVYERGMQSYEHDRRRYEEWREEELPDIVGHVGSLLAA